MIAIGIDVSKEKLDIYMNNSLKTINNNIEAIHKAFCKIERQATRIVLESTGVFHRLAHKTLCTLGFSVMVINPYQSRHFAKAMNVICKTDKVDARILSLYAARMPYEPTPVMSEKEEELQSLKRHLEGLMQTRGGLAGRAREAQGFVKKSLERSLKHLDKEIGQSEKELEELIESDPELSHKCALLESIPGIGRPTAHMLISLGRELGHLTNRQISSLFGLAPMNCDSGTYRGKRRIQRGRQDIRHHLYMPILGAVTRHNQRLKQFYQRLIHNGKNGKVALIACMRKLVIYANTLLRKNEVWRENFASN